MIRRRATILTQIPVNWGILKQELTEIEIEMLILWVKVTFNISNTEESLGLPYTCSSGFGAIWVTNQEFIISDPEDKHVQGFSLSIDNKVIVLTHTIDEVDVWYVGGKHEDYHG